LNLFVIWCLELGAYEDKRKFLIMETIGLIAAVTLPLFNIPLIVKMIRRKSSRDISMTWAAGVWVCIVLMFPSGLMSEDIVWKSFNIVNIILFSGVFFTVLKYRKR